MLRPEKLTGVYFCWLLHRKIHQCFFCSLMAFDTLGFIFVMEWRFSFFKVYVQWPGISVLTSVAYWMAFG